MDDSKALMIKANDKDVVAIAISVMKSLNDPVLEKCGWRLAREIIID